MIIIVSKDGIRGLNIPFVVTKIVLPVCSALGLALSLPYIMAHSLAPLVIGDPETLIMIERRIYPFLLPLITIVSLTLAQLKQCRKLYEHIKNDRYDLTIINCNSLSLA